MAITRRKSMATAKEDSSPPPPPSTPPQISSNSEEQPPPQKTQSEPTIAESASNYEQSREQRIKENRERLQKLGIVDLSLKLKSMAPARRTPRAQSERKTPLKSLNLTPAEPPRRSSRLQNVTPVTYTEPKEEKSRRNKDIVLEEGAKPEVYTEEHEKLLGNTEMPWTFFVDGYRADGTRIYDPVNGKTCHQCRQKTLGMRTHCSKCNLVQGQFCGDCLYMRYGEHVVEANQNPNWVCPACRGICNCSLCRQAKGWAPTGSLYRKISSLGFKSVAHYLITTKRAPENSDKSSDTSQPAKRSLPFDGLEVVKDNESGQAVNLDDKTENKDAEKTEVSPEAENLPNLNLEVERSRKRPRKEDVETKEHPEKINDTAEDPPSTNVQAKDDLSSKTGRNNTRTPRPRSRT